MRESGAMENTLDAIACIGKCSRVEKIACADAEFGACLSGNEPDRSSSGTQRGGKATAYETVGADDQIH